MKQAKPTKLELMQAIHNMVPDIIAPDLTLLFVGINPGLYTAWAQHHFAHPGNRFWPALYNSGLTPTLLHYSHNQQLLDLGYGITNLVARPTVRADELSKQELIAGRQRLLSLVDQYQPRWVAVLGVGAYRTAFNQPKAQVGRQDMLIGQSKVWLLTNPSGLNAHYTPTKLAESFYQLKLALDEDNT